MRLAYFSPLNPVRSGISDYSEELLPWLGRGADIDLFVDGYIPTNRLLGRLFSVADASRFDARRSLATYDACVYQVGNHACHAYAYRTLQRQPGFVVLHDFYLHHLIVAMTVAQGDERAYVREMGYSHGRAGIDSARQALLSNHQFEYERFAANRRVIDLSFGLIVHSQYTRRLVENVRPNAPVAVVPLLAVPSRAPTAAAVVRRRLGFCEEVLFGSFGQVTPSKRIDVALRAFRAVHARFPETRFVIAGEEAPGVELDPLIRSLGLGDVVRHVGYLPLSDFLDLIATVDVGIALRYPVLGETSASLLRLLAAGKPTIVSDAGPFAEFPDEFCPKIPVDENEVERLAATMARFAGDVDLRRAAGEAARTYVEREHAPAACARQYLGFIDQVLG